MTIPELTDAGLALAVLGAFLIGLGKGGLPGAGNLTIWIYASVFPPKMSVGILLPVLICGDLAAVLIYRQHANWYHLGRIIWPMALGVLGGFFLFDLVPADAFGPVIGVMLLAMTALHLGWLGWKKQRAARLPRADGEGANDEKGHGWPVAYALGVLGGIATMLANAAGPVAAFYLLLVRLPKFAFIGTTAWLFGLINVIKLPFQFAADNLTIVSLQLSLGLGAFAMLGALVAPRIVQHIPQKPFESLVWTMVIFAGITLTMG